MATDAGKEYNSDLDYTNVQPIIVMQVTDPTGLAWNSSIVQRYPNKVYSAKEMDEFRYLEKNTLVSKTQSGIQFSITYSLVREAKIEAAINLSRTIWVIVVLTAAALHFNNATNRLLLHPLERMLEIVKKIAKDPSSAAAQDEM